MDFVSLYISAASDLRPERETLGTAIAEIPVSLGWKIKQSPLNQREELNLDAVRTADLHFLLLGGDVRAPVGVEWMASQSAARWPIVYARASTARTPAAASFYSQLAQYVCWNFYRDLADLRRQVLQHISAFILELADHFALQPGDFEALLDLQSSPGADEKQEKQELGGAGASAVVLTRSRFRPSGGVLIEPDGE